MRKTSCSILALLISLSAGCATLTPREAADNVCNFIFLAAIPVSGPILAAALCAFGPSALPDEIEEDEDEDV